MAKFHQPDVFEFSALGLPNFDEVSIIWHGNRLGHYRDGDEREFHPSQEAWGIFWKTLDKIDAWSWRGEYINKGILDGEEWVLKIAYNGRELSCSGSNSYPPRFEELRLAMNRLMFEY